MREILIRFFTLTTLVACAIIPIYSGFGYAWIFCIPVGILAFLIGIKYG